MAIGKNKRITKAGSGNKKKIVDVFARKEHYIVKAPCYFNVTNIGNTIVSKSHGLNKSEDSLKGRIFDINMADLQKDEGQCHRKVQLICEEVQGRNVLTEFYGLRVTRDYLCSQIRKRHTIIEANTEIVTLDGFTLRLFCFGFTKDTYGKKKINCYAKSSQQRAIRARMIRIMRQEASKYQLRDLVKCFIPEGISKKIEKACNVIYPLHSVSIFKVKVIKKPRQDSSRIFEIHTATAEAASVNEPAEAKNLLTANLAA